MYHRIGYPKEGAGDAGLYVLPEEFEKQIRYLEEKGYCPLSFAELLPMISGEKTPPRRGVVITFDDASETVFRYAYPILRRYRFFGVVFVVTGYVGATASWSRLGESREHPLLGWEEIRRMQQDGMCFESHTVHHAHLAQLEPKDALRELYESKACLEEELGAGVRCLAYPYGEYTSKIQEMAAEVGYECACSIRRGNVHRLEDLFCLKRVWIGPETSLTRFRYRLSRLYELEHRSK